MDRNTNADGSSKSFDFLVKIYIGLKVDGMLQIVHMEEVDSMQVQ